MSIKSLYPDIRPSLNLDFANSKALDGRITFTRDSTATYVGANGLIQTVQRNAPRFDHDPITHESLGLLIEEQRTNQFPYGSQISGTNGWGVLNLTFSGNQTIAPDGTNNASKVGKDSAATEIVYFNDDTTIISGNTYTQSIFVKASEINYFQIAPSTGFSAGHQNFDLVNGVLGTSDGTIDDASITPYPNGWYRCSLTVTSNASYSTGRMVMGPAQSASAGRLDSVSGSIGDGIYVWGAQLENGAFPTSYIPTSGTSATRPAEYATITGESFNSFFNPYESTLYASVVSNGTNNGGIVGIDRSDGVTHIDPIYTGSTITFYGSGGPGNKPRSGDGRDKLIQTWNDTGDTQSFTANGATPSSYTFTSAIAPDKLSIGRYSYLGGGFFNGIVSEVRYYSKALPDAQLQLLTK